LEASRFHGVLGRAGEGQTPFRIGSGSGHHVCTVMVDERMDSDFPLAA
jgi:hypothetical protein